MLGWDSEFWACQLGQLGGTHQEFDLLPDMACGTPWEIHEKSYPTEY
jgi:hypothetical protein